MSNRVNVIGVGMVEFAKPGKSDPGLHFAHEMA